MTTPWKILASVLCLSLLAGPAAAQQKPQPNSERLKTKIEEVERIYKRTLLRQYEEYADSLRKDLKDLREARAVLADDKSEESERLDADIAAWAKKLAEAEASAGVLKAEAVEERASRPAAADDQRPEGCGEIPSDKLPPGAIWCSNKNNISVKDLAERAAPILWFSPDEPLRQAAGGAKKGEIPEALPGDDTAESPVVYYRLSKVTDWDVGNARLNAPPNGLWVGTLNEVTLSYYFYYSQDKGLQGHRNDLESLSLDIAFTPLDANGNKTRPGAKAAFYVASVKTAVGAAHAVSWFGNWLSIGEDERNVSLPLTVLVEEGKHATAPDRNADGVYSPGYDVNRRYEDAWGVRDLIGSGQLGGARYEGSMTKPRRPGDMLVARAEGLDRAALMRAYRGPYKDAVMNARSYVLKPVEPGIIDKVKKSEAGTKADFEAQGLSARQVRKKMGLNIVGLMEREKFERGPRVKTGYGPFEKVASVARKGVGVAREEEVRDALTFGYRFDGQNGFTFAPPLGRYDIPLVGGYALLKVNAAPFGPEKRISFEGLYTPSVARSFDWYFSGGPELFLSPGESDWKTRFAYEGGLRVRVFKKRHWGGRVGLRAGGLHPREPRIVLEFGTGAF